MLLVLITKLKPFAKLGCNVEASVLDAMRACVELACPWYACHAYTSARSLKRVRVQRSHGRCTGYVMCTSCPDGRIRVCKASTSILRRAPDVRGMLA
jgi:hypothetical protein